MKMKNIENIEKYLVKYRARLMKEGGLKYYDLGLIDALLKELRGWKVARIQRMQDIPSVTTEEIPPAT